MKVGFIVVALLVISTRVDCSTVSVSVSDKGYMYTYSNNKYNGYSWNNVYSAPKGTNDQQRGFGQPEHALVGHDKIFGHALVRHGSGFGHALAGHGNIFGHASAGQAGILGHALSGHGDTFGHSLSRHGNVFGNDLGGHGDTFGHGYVGQEDIFGNAAFDLRPLSHLLNEVSVWTDSVFCQ